MRSHRPSVLDVAVLHMVGLDARAGNRETVVCWHREGFRRFWDLAIAGARASANVFQYREKSERSYATWRAPIRYGGAPRIHGELTKLRSEISQRTVGRLLPRRGRPRSQW